MYENNVLKFFGHEEGRIRPTLPITSNGNQPFAYDYFLKDHLGNIRTVLTDEQQTGAYTVASLETDNLTNEKNFYFIPDAASVRVIKLSVSGYPADTYTNPNDYVHKLNGNGTKIGTAIVLKVMAGDKINIRANSWWKNYSVPANPSNTISALIDIANALITGVPGTLNGKIGIGQLNAAILNPSVTDLINTRNTNNYATGKPKAYVNWILLDEQFKQVAPDNGKNSGFEQVGADNEFKTHTKSGIELTKSGYLYVYVSNESTDINVFFDNLQVTHNRGPLLEETHYYPFGLTIAGISSKAAGSIQNKFKFNGGNELQSQEFSDGSGLETYDARHRMFDPQIGKFLQIDPLDGITRELSLYAFANNNPVSLNDPLGLSATTPGVNSNDPEKDAARMQDVTVTGHKKGSPNRVGGSSENHLRGFHFPTYTRQDRKTWDNAQALYNSRIAKKQNLLQGDESEYYRNYQKRLQTLYQADEDHKKMSVGALLMIGSPVLIASLSGTGAGSLLLNAVRPKLQTSLAGGIADIINQKVVLGRSWGDVNLATVASNTLLGGRNMVSSSLWESTGSLFTLSVNNIGTNFNNAGLTDFSTGVTGNLFGNGFGGMFGGGWLQKENGQIVGSFLEASYKTGGEFSGNLISNSMSPQ